MKICQLCAVDFTLYHFLMPLMRATREAGHEVIGICTDGPLLDKVRAEGFRIVPVRIVRGYNPLDHLRTFVALVRVFKRERFDIVHVHTPVAALVARFAAAWVRVPLVVYTAHGFYFHDRMPAWKRRIFLALEYVAGRFTDVLFTQAAEDAETARRHKLCRGAVIEAIGNGSDPGKFYPAVPDDSKRRALRAQLGAGDATPVIAMIGRLVAEKGYPELFAAMRNVDATLWVIGDRLKSDHAQVIDAAIVEAERDPILSKRIRFLGYRGDVPALLRAADIFTLPSHREGMPRSIVEAMLSGLPVVATSIRGSREQVVDGETGFLVPVNDPVSLAARLSRLAEDAELRRRMARAGLSRARALFDEAVVVRRQLERLSLVARPVS